MQPWFEADPERLKQELDALGEAHIEYKIDDAARERGKLILALTYDLGGEKVALEAEYPDLFPFFQPEVAAAKLSLARHQHPNGGNLCLLGRRTEQWHVDDTVAGI